MSNFVIWAFPLEKVKTVDFSEPLQPVSLKVSSIRHIIDLMKVCEYRRSRAQCHVHTKILTKFSQEPNFVLKLSGTRNEYLMTLCL